MNDGLKKQLLWVVAGTAIATLVLGLGLSLAVNYSLRQLESRPDVILPGPGTDPVEVPQ